MTPPDAPLDPENGTKALPPAVCRLRVLQKRTQFLALNHGQRWGTKGFLLQGRFRDDGDVQVGVGYTCSKKVGNAVARNRAKRRLREIARLVLPNHAQPGWDYCLIGKAEVTATREFTQMQDDLIWALRKIHGAR